MSSGHSNSVIVDHNQRQANKNHIFSPLRLDNQKINIHKKILDVQQKQHYRCFYHPNQIITNYSRNCYLPLCPECMNNHIIEHQQQGQYPNIQNIDNVLHDFDKELKTQIENLLKNSNQIEDIQTNYDQILQNSFFNKIISAKQKIVKLIEQYFDNFEQEYYKNYNEQKQKNMEELNKANLFLQRKLEDLTQFSQNIYHEDGLKYLVRLDSSHEIQVVQQINNDCQQYINNFQSLQTTDVVIDDNQLYQINIALGKYINQKNSAFHPQVQNFNSINSNSKLLEDSSIKNQRNDQFQFKNQRNDQSQLRRSFSNQNINNPHYVNAQIRPPDII